MYTVGVAANGDCVSNSIYPIPGGKGLPSRTFSPLDAQPTSIENKAEHMIQQTTPLNVTGSKYEMIAMTMWFALVFIACPPANYL